MFYAAIGVIFINFDIFVKKLMFLLSKDALNCDSNLIMTLETVVMTSQNFTSSSYNDYIMTFCSTILTYVMI